MQTNNKRSHHMLVLAEELLEDVELERLGAEALILKAARLARLTGNGEAKAWLNYELSGYNSKEKLSLTLMGRSGRWENREEKKGYWAPLAEIDAIRSAITLQLQGMKLPPLSGDHLRIVVRDIKNDTSQLRNQLVRVSGIRSRVMGLLHNFVSETYYELLFSGMAENIFQQYKQEADVLLAGSSAEILEKLPLIYDRLSSLDGEAVSQALNTVRRLIDAFADALQAPQEEDWNKNGNAIKLGKRHHQNRLNYYVHTHCPSSSRQKKLRQNLANIYDRVSTGVHAEVSAAEAKALLLATYLYFGEVISLKDEETGL